MAKDNRLLERIALFSCSKDVFGWFNSPRGGEAISLISLSNRSILVVLFSHVWLLHLY